MDEKPRARDKGISEPNRQISPARRLTIGVAALLVISVLAYSATYLALVRKTYLLMGVNPVNGLNWFEIEAEYSIGGNAAQRFFAPIHAADRLVRSGYWETLEDPGTGLTMRNPRPGQSLNPR